MAEVESVIYPTGKRALIVLILTQQEADLLRDSDGCDCRIEVTIQPIPAQKANLDGPD